MKEKILISAMIAIAVCLFTTSYAYALGMTAGPVRIVADVGSSGSSSFGLLNNGNETFTVQITADGDAAQFIEFPTTLELVPGKMTYVDVKATIPTTYDGSLGGNITGFIYATQAGAPGQVQINVQAKKTVQIFVPSFGGELPQTQPQAESTQVNNPSMITGFSTMVYSNSWIIAIIVVAVIAIIFVFIFLRRFDISINKKEVKR